MPVRPPAPRRELATGELWWRSALVVGAALVGWMVTGWPAVAVLCAAAAGVGPMLIGLRRRRDVAIARSDALAAWAEMLRDTIASHAGLSEAISITARVAPAPIRSEVQTLAVRAERDSLSDALRRFAADVADPVADLIVASLVIAADRQAQRLAELLAEIASAAREQSAMRIRVETGQRADLCVVKGAGGDHARPRRRLDALLPDLHGAIRLGDRASRTARDRQHVRRSAVGTGRARTTRRPATAARGHRRIGRRRDRRKVPAMTVWWMALAGALAGGGVLLMVRGMVGTTEPLAALVAELHRPRHGARTLSRRTEVVDRLAGRRTICARGRSGCL